MEDGREEEAIEGAGCNVRVAGGGIPGVEIIADPRHSCFLHPAGIAIHTNAQCWPIQYSDSLFLICELSQDQGIDSTLRFWEINGGDPKTGPGPQATKICREGPG